MDFEPPNAAVIRRDDLNNMFKGSQEFDKSVFAGVKVSELKRMCGFVFRRAGSAGPRSGDAWDSRHDCYSFSGELFATSAATSAAYLRAVCALWASISRWDPSTGSLGLWLSAFFQNSRSVGDVRA